MPDAAPDPRPRMIVTGGLGALGRVVVRAALDAGWRVASIDHGHHEGEAQAGEHAIGGVDLTDWQAAQAALYRVAALPGDLRAVINLAGGFAWEKVFLGDNPVWSGAPEAETWDRMHALNLKTALNVCRAARTYMRLGGGAIVNVGAYAALGPAAVGMGPYTASKAGVHKLTEALAAEYAEFGIRVNAVCPSTLDTPANRRDMPDVDPAAWVSLEDLARVILWLASDESAAVTGALIPVTRGRA